MKVWVLEVGSYCAAIELENGKRQKILKALLPYGSKKGDIIEVETSVSTAGKIRKFNSISKKFNWRPSFRN